MIPTSAIALFCEDIREEKSGGFTLIGVMPDNANVPPLPDGSPSGAVGVMPKLCIFIRLNFDPHSELGPIATKFIFPDGTEQAVEAIDEATVARAKSETLAQNGPIAGIVSRLVLAPFPVLSLGRMRVEMTIGSQAYLAGALNFIREEPSLSPKT